MKLNEYQELAQRTKNKDLPFEKRLAVAALGLVGEAGEVAEHVKKHLGHGHKLDDLFIIKELGDVMWYIAELSTLTGCSMEYVAKKNIDKLKNRYPDGFSEERSVNRVE